MTTPFTRAALALLLLAPASAARAEDAAAVKPAPVDEAVFTVLVNGARTGGESMTVAERSPQRARYVTDIDLGKGTAFHHELVTGPQSALSEYRLKGEMGGHDFEMHASVVDDRVRFSVVKDGEAQRFQTSVPLMTAALDGNTAAHWQALLDGLDGDGPWTRDTIAAQVVKVMRLTIVKKKTAAQVTAGGKAQPLVLYEVTGPKKAQLYVTRDGKVVLVEIPADRLVFTRNGLVVSKGTK